MERSAKYALRRALAATVRRLRTERDLTQAQLADLLGVPQSWVSNVEAGSRRIEVVEGSELASTLGVTIDELLRQARLHIEEEE